MRKRSKSTKRTTKRKPLRQASKAQKRTGNRGLKRSKKLIRKSRKKTKRKSAKRQSTTRGPRFKRTVPKTGEMSPVFRKYTRKIRPGKRERVYAIAVVTVKYDRGRVSVSYPAFPIEIGYRNASDIKGFTLDEVETNLKAAKGGHWQVESVQGFVQVKPTKERAGILFPKKKK